MSRRYVLAAIIIAGTGLVANGGSHAQSVEEWRATEKGTAESDKTLGGKYEGVTPGSGNTLPKVEELRTQEGSFVTWPGFMMRDGGGSRFFIQSTGGLEYTITTKKHRVTIRIANTGIFLKNNRNPLVTTHFNTPVKRAYLKKRRENVDVLLDLKVAANPQISQFVSDDGYNYMFIDFASGRYPTATNKSAASQGEFKAL